MKIVPTQIPLAQIWLPVYQRSADNLYGASEGMTDSLETMCSKTRGAYTGRS
ncbi:hypothetical protein K474DRAFT_1664828 [Panus rudis PR-1116 ss-1]|nr:hypothetical protein K474DRAFT_1664828 [Panus rudis PR-1116 ss-1]